MPCQVSWQSVAIKPQPSVHGLGVEAAVAAAAPAGRKSGAQASTPEEAAAATRITAAKNAEFCTASLPGSTCTIVSWYKVGRQESTGAICRDVRKFRSEWQPRHSHLKRPNGFGGATASTALFLTPFERGRPLQIEISRQHHHVANCHAAWPRQHEHHHISHFAGLQQTPRLPGFLQLLRRPIREQGANDRAGRD